jgi:phage terminase large subunit-like protein
LPPDEAGSRPDWSTWLILGGRGSGKTRAGAEWVRKLTERAVAVSTPVRIALVGPSYAEAREVMVDGVSGLNALRWRGERPQFISSRRLLTWSDGSTAHLFSAEDPEELRGPQFDAAWCDELGKWRNAQDTFDMLQFGLRLGERPRQVITTTPRPIPLVRQLLDDPEVAVTRMATRENARNLPPAFLKAVEARYANARLGRQELDGELIEDIEDGLFDRHLIERHRVRNAPDLARVVVAVDPPASHDSDTSVCGIVCAGIGLDGDAYVLEDASVPRATPARWANAVAACFDRWQADRVVAEVNQGGDMVESVLRAAYPSLPFKAVRATRGKRVRAEPVAALYERGLVHHAGGFAALEDQMCNFGPDGLSLGQSPDRVDALVWGLNELMLGGTAGTPRVRSV